MRGFLKLTKNKLQQKSINELKNGLIYLKRRRFNKRNERYYSL